MRRVFLMAVGVFITSVAFGLPKLPSKPGGPEKPNPFAAAARHCPMMFRGVSVQQYLAAAQSAQLTRKSLQMAQEKAIGHFGKASWMSDKNLQEHPEVQHIVPQLFQLFMVSVSAYVRGIDHVIPAYGQDFVQQLLEVGIQDFGVKDFERLVREAAQDPEIFPATSMIEFILRDSPTIEALLFQIEEAVPGLSELEFPGSAYLGPIIGGPRQAEMIRTALQYSTTLPGDKILEIGYGTPTVPLGMRHFTNQHVVAIDPFVLPEKANEVLNPFGVELLQGFFPDTPEAMERIRSQAPYTLIMALDTIKKSRTPVWESKTPPKILARNLYDLLDEGGVVVLLNDFEEEPIFTKEQARAVGFRIVRWGVKRKLSPEMIRLMPYDLSNPKAGSLAAFVLRKGVLPKERIKMLATTTKAPSR